MCRREIAVTTRGWLFSFRDPLAPFVGMPGSNRSRAGLWLALSFAWKLGYSIAVPLVALLLIGRFLDQRLGTSPWLLMTGLVVSFIVTNVLMFREAISVMKQADKDGTRSHTTNPTFPSTPTRETEQGNEKIKDQNAK